MDHKEFSRRGGMARSAAKTRAARRNARKPRGRWITAVSYKVAAKVDGKELTIKGMLILPGKLPFTMRKTHDKIVEEIERERDLKVERLLDYSTISRLIK